MTRTRALKALLATGIAVGAMATSALAGGFAIREQSVEYQGMSFAGNAAGGGGLSGMFWNPAVLGEFEGFQTDSNYTLIAPYAKITGTDALGTGSSGNMGSLALVPASYMSYQLTDDLVAGLSMNSPFGLGNKTDFAWVGQTFNRKSQVKTYNGQLALAYNVSPDITIGGGVIMEYMTADLRSAGGVAPTSSSVVVQGDDIGFGFSGGVVWRPMDGTHLGFGFRSAVKHTLKGEDSLRGTNPAIPGFDPISADVTLPESATLSIRQDISDETRILASAEWTNWSRLKQLDIVCSGGGTNLALCGLRPPGAVLKSLQFGWHDGYFFSAGLEHDLSDTLTIRGGLAYEISPIQAPDERSLRVPDSDRLWLSAGASLQITEKMKANLAYTHIFFKEGDIDRTESGLHFVGKSNAHMDILSAGMSVDF